MVPFVIEEYIHVKFPNYEKWREACLAWPYVLSENNSTFEESRYIPLELENTPNGEQAVRRGARVEASDGYLGQVEELLVNSKNMHVTHLVVREKHLWRNRDVAIPVSEIDHVDEDSVALKLDRKGIKELPAVPIERWSLLGFIENQMNNNHAIYKFFWRIQIFMLPLSDTSRRRLHFPAATVSIIGLNFIVFFFELAGGEPFHQSLVAGTGRYCRRP